MIWTLPWVWFAAAVGLGILEILAPGYVFLGFAIGAAVMGLLVWPDWSLAAMAADSLPLALLAFALLSLAAWVALRAWLGVRKGQTKVWEKDINEN
ncbi:NfeD family protein [Pseudoroseicyclus sp. CXY001]|uniref:NfeD family protein n=1 Tax=Pseudoroseicyclus sp. CXY001 TaxID=3242492 RepID=UPI003570F655